MIEVLSRSVVGLVGAVGLGGLSMGYTVSRFCFDGSGRSG